MDHKWPVLCYANSHVLKTFGYENCRSQVLGGNDVLKAAAQKENDVLLENVRVDSQDIAV